MNARYLVVLSILLLSYSIKAQDQHIIDSLTARLQENLHDSDRTNTLNALSGKMMDVNLDTAIILAKEALTIAETAKWQLGIVKSIGKLGVYYYSKGEYPKALEYHFRGLKMNEEMGRKTGIAITLGNIGVVYRNQGEYSKALAYYLKALNLDEELDRKSGIAANQSNIGIVYQEQGDYPKALEYYFKALDVYEELGNKNGITIILGNIGNALLVQGDYSQAREYYFKVLAMHKEQGNKYGIAVNLGNIGYLYSETGEFERAEKALREAITLSKEIGGKGHLKYLYESLSHLYDTTARPARAFEAYKLFIIYRDSIDNEENTKAQTRSEMKYEYEKQELIKEQEEKEQARLEAEVTGRRDNLQYSIILIAILVLFGGVLGLGFINVSEKMAEGIIFFSFLILFEFLLVLADPYIDNWSGGAPGIKLLFNAAIAALIFPAHAFFEARLKRRLAK